MAKPENIEFILMDIFSHQITPPLPSPLPTESSLPPVLLPPSTSQQSMSQLHVHIPSKLPALVLLPPSTSQPSVLVPPSTSQQSMSQLHIPSESPAPVLLPPSTSQPSNYKYYSPCDIELLLDLDLPHTVDTITEYFNRINVFDIKGIIHYETLLHETGCMQHVHATFFRTVYCNMLHEPLVIKQIIN